MDPLSITASIIAVLQLAQQLTTYAISVRNVSDEQGGVAQEASNLCSLLTTLNFRVEGAKSTDPWFNQVKLLCVKIGPLEQLRQLLEQLVKKISITSTPKTIDHTLSKLTWQFTKKDVADLLGRIERLKTLINLALLNDLTTLTYAINHNITHLTEQTKQIRTEIQVIQQSISDMGKDEGGRNTFEDEADNDAHCTNAVADQNNNDTFGNESDILEAPSLVQVRLAHYSVKECLSGRSSLESHFRNGRAHELIAQGCLTYIFHMGKNAPLTYAMIAEHPLAGYAAAEWPEHMIEIQDKLSDTLFNASLRLVLDEGRNRTLWEQLCHFGMFIGMKHLTEYTVIDCNVPPAIITISELGLVDLLPEAIDKGAYIEDKDEDENTALHKASGYGREEVVKLLLERGANIEARNNSGETALLQASYWGCKTVVQLLLENGADVNVRDKRGFTPLFEASLYDYQEVVKLLIAGGADANTRSDNGQTSLMAAFELGRDETARMLRDHGAIEEAV